MLKYLSHYGQGYKGKYTYTYNEWTSRIKEPNGNLELKNEITETKIH